MEFLLSGISGLFGATLMYPADIFKVYVQFNDELKRNKTNKFGLLKQLYKSRRYYETFLFCI